MNLKFNTLCSLIKNIRINTKNDIKRLEYLIPAVIGAIKEHPAHTSTLIYYLSKSTSQSRIGSGCLTCKGLCSTTYKPISSHIYNILDNFSPKALAKILKVYSNCLYDDKLTDQIKLRLCYFMLSCMNFPKNYFDFFNEWTKRYSLSPDDYLISLNSSFDHSKFFLPLVAHDVADLIQSLYQEAHKAHLSGANSFVLDISIDYIAKLFKAKLSEKDIHSVTRIFYFYNECSYFNNKVRELWLGYMDRYVTNMNIFDICTMLHSFHNDLDQHKTLIKKILSQIDSLLSSSVYTLKSLGMILNGLFKCNINNSYIAQIVYDKSKKLFDSNPNPRELMQLIKGLEHFDIHPKDLVCLLHSLPFDETTFDLHDLTIIFSWFDFYALNTANIINIINKNDLSNSKFENLLFFSLEISKSQYWDDSMEKKLSESLKFVYNKNKNEVTLGKLVKLYELFTPNYNKWIEDEILFMIQEGDLLDCFKFPLVQHSLFKEALAKRCYNMPEHTDFLDSLSSLSEVYNISILPLDELLKYCKLQHLPVLLSHELEKILPFVDIKNIIQNTQNKVSALCIYRCIMCGLRGKDAGILIDFFIKNNFMEFRELMMLSIIAGLPNIEKGDSLKIADYITTSLADNNISNTDKLTVINKLIPVSLKYCYSISNNLFSIGLPISSLDINLDCLHLFISYAVKLDMYKTDIILHTIHRMITHCNMLRPSVLANLGLVGMQFWNSPLRMRWLRLVLLHTDTTSDFFTPLQLSLFVNGADHLLIELHLMLEVIRRHGRLVNDLQEIQIITEIEQLHCISGLSGLYTIIYV